MTTTKLIAQTAEAIAKAAQMLKDRAAMLALWKQQDAQYKADKARKALLEKERKK